MIQGYALTPNQDKATPKAIHGSVLYPTIITHTENPSQEEASFNDEAIEYDSPEKRVHMLPASYRNTCRIRHNAVDRLIKHFDGTKTLAIEFSIDNLAESVIFATDAAFADNRDRKRQD
jgi:hypothetical protein